MVFVTFWLTGYSFGAFSPVFGGIKTENPISIPSPTPPSGKIFLYNGTSFYTSFLNILKR